ncbi:MAG: alanine racemase [Actinomycetota bacterium]
MLPAIKINLSKIEHNTKAIVSTFNALGIQVVGVVKACLGNLDVARSMVAGGVSLIADSRLQNLERLSALNVPLMMLRQPMVEEVLRVVELTEMCLVSELKGIKMLSNAAGSVGKKYRVIVMVETGDLREGVLPLELLGFMKEASKVPWIELAGIGANVACLQGVPPTSSMLELLVDLAKKLRRRLGIDLPIISGGNSSVWKLVEASAIPPEINQLRLGEAILLGQETINLDPIPGTFQDAFVIEAEVIEAREKPLPKNTIALLKISDDKHRKRNSIKLRKRVILALGIQDIGRGELKPLDKGLQILRRSSDHLVVDITSSHLNYKVGDKISFIPTYEALLAAMTSPFVKKVLLR